MLEIIKLLRVKHYIKNLLLFIPFFFSGGLFSEPNKIGKIVLGVCAFSCVSSVVYIINDIKDVDKDRKHEVKKNRPIASGKVSVKSAVIIAVIMFALMCIINTFINGSVFNYGIIYLLCYFLLNIFYSIRLKNMPIIDILILASGFLIRVLYGAYIVQVDVSNWLSLTVIAFSLYMGLGKRRNEFIKQDQGLTRAVLKKYSYPFLDKMMQMCMTLGIVFYSLWTLNIQDHPTMANKNYLVWTIPIVIYICMKYTLIVEGDSYGDPVDVLLSDKELIIAVLIYVIAILFFIYGKVFLG